jgi:biotin carboxyl carrier protein
MSELSSEAIEHALSIARLHGFSEVELSLGPQSFRGRLEPEPKRKSSVRIAAAADVPRDLLKDVKSTLVGYYSSPPNLPRIGDAVEVGDRVAVITALGIPTDIEAPVAGHVFEIVVEDGQAVEYGQLLLRIEEAP